MNDESSIDRLSDLIFATLLIELEFRARNKGIPPT